MAVDTKVVVHHLYAGIAGVVLACKHHGILYVDTVDTLFVVATVLINNKREDRR
jgi:hypothetical protein